MLAPTIICLNLQVCRSQGPGFRFYARIVGVLAASGLYVVTLKTQ